MSQIFQITISGTDGAGFVWQNVFHIQADNPTATIPAFLSDLNDLVNDVIIPPLLDCMSNTYKVLDIASKEISPNPSYSFHKVVNGAGTRAGVGGLGAAAGMISFYPAGGSHIGRIFVAGSLIADWVADKIVGAYTTVLEDLATAFLTLNGSDVTYHWQFGIWNKSTPAFLPIVDHVVSGIATTLNKRMRA